MSVSEPNTVSLRGIQKRFGSIVAVRDLDLGVARGSFFSILGPTRARSCSKASRSSVCRRTAAT
jgi:ABC-type sugar transport system ATPase subunit